METDHAGVPQRASSINPMYNDLEGAAAIVDDPTDGAEQKWYKSRKGKAGIMAAVGCVALIGIVAGTTGGSTAASGTGEANGGASPTDPAGSLARQEFPVSEFGVQAMMKQYPGGPLAFPTGHVKLGTDNRFEWKLAGLTPGQTGGVHIHAGTTCEASGGHHFEGEVDGWMNTTWTSDAGGESTGFFDVDLVEGAFPFAENVGHAVVVHDETGARVACGELSALNTDVSVVKAKLTKYPGLESDSFPSGYAFLSAENVFSWNLAHLGAAAKGGIHIHEGLTCETAGAHWFLEGETDGWNEVFYTADAAGSASGSVALADLPGIYKFAANINHAVTVHAPNGTRVACGVLKPYLITEEEEELEEGDYDYYSVGASFGAYPGGPEDHPKGRVWLDSNNRLSWGLSKLEPNVMGGLHIHAGKTCETAGPHHWDSTMGPDPWNDVKYTSHANGKAWGKLDVDSLVAAHGFVANLDRTVVLHNAAGQRVACAELRAREDYGVKAIMGAYPGGPEDHPRGRVVLDSANVLTWQLTSLPASTSGGIHIHQGTSCDFSQGHHYDASKYDGWLDTRWASNDAGVSRGMITVDDVEGAFGFPFNVDRVIVLHDPDGKRVACGKLLPYVWYPEREEDNVEEILLDYSTQGVFRTYPGFAGSAPRGHAYLDSDNVFSFVLRKLEPDSQGGVHIHVGATCESSGGHHYKPGTVDGWLDVKWSSTSNGEARGVVDLNTLPGAYPFVANLDRTVVVHNSAGARVACAVLRSNADTGVTGVMGVYPDSESSIIPGGLVFLTKRNTFSWYLTGLEPGVTGGVHIHAGMSCGENTGPHWFLDGEVDGWNKIQYSSTSMGTARGVISLDTISGLYPFADNVGHTVVVHAADGSRVGCAVLDRFTENAGDEAAEASEAHGEIENDWSDWFTARAKLDRYPGLDESISPPEGRVLLNHDNVLTFILQKLPPDQSGGIHIHAGKTCETAGPHWYRPGPTDSWNNVFWKSDSKGRAHGVVDVDALVGLYGFASNLDHAVVVHDAAGARVACGVLSSRGKPIAVENQFRRYPGLDEAVPAPSADALLSIENVLEVDAWNLEPNAASGVHIHVGLSCENSMGHHYLAGEADFWNDVKLHADENGDAFLKIDLNEYVGAYSFEENAYRAIVIHNSAGVRVACTTLSLLKVGRDRDWDE